MADTDPYLIDVLKKSVEGDIEKRVYERIRDDLLRLKFIGGFLGILILVLALFHSSIFTFVVDLGSTELKRKINLEVAQQLKSLDAAHSKMEATRELFAGDMNTALEKLRRQRDEIVALREDFAKKEKEVAEMTDTITEAGDTTRERIATFQSEAIEQVKQQYELMIERIAALQKAIVADLNKRDSGPPSAETNKVDVQPAKVEQRAPTVFFQFAGFDRAEAQKISKAIQAAGWKVPGEERTPEAVKTNQIRYNPADKESARRLEQDANRVLRELNLRIGLTLKENLGVKPGFVEIWIYKP